MSSEVKLPARVFACLEDGFITITLEYGIGMMNGGALIPAAVDLVPGHLRMPNTDVEVTLQLKPWKILRIEAPSEGI